MKEEKTWSDYWEESKQHESLCVALIVAGVIVAFAVFGLGALCSAIVGIVSMFKALFTWNLLPLVTTLICILIIAFCIGILAYILNKFGIFED